MHMGPPAIRADGTDHGKIRMTAIHVESEGWMTQILKRDNLAPFQPHFLPYGKEEGQGRMGEFVAQQRLHDGDQRRHRSSVVTTEGRGTLGYDAITGQLGHSTPAEWNSIHMSREQSA